MMSHDWPLHAVHAGNVQQLIRRYHRIISAFHMLSGLPQDSTGPKIMPGLRLENYYQNYLYL